VHAKQKQMLVGYQGWRRPVQPRREARGGK